MSRRKPLRTPLRLFPPQLAKHIHSPHPRQVIPMMALELIQRLELRIGDDEICARHPKPSHGGG